MPYGFDDYDPDPEDVTFEDVVFGRETKSKKAIEATFPDGTKRLVPYSQCVDKPQPNTQGRLVVTAWIAGKWEEEGPPEESERDQMVRCPSVVVLRETERAIQVRQLLRDPEWVAKAHIDPSSEVQNDGDSGVLVVRAWVAEDKNLEAEGVAVRRDVARDVSRGRWDNYHPSDPPDPDDDIPF